MDYAQLPDGNLPLNVEADVREEEGVTGFSKKKQVRLILILAGVVVAVATVAIVLGVVLTNNGGSSDNSPTPVQGPATSVDQQYQSYTVSIPSSPMGSISLGASTMLGGMRFYTEVSFPTSSGTVTQQMMIDSGSSTASLCDAELAATLTAAKQDAVSCNLYGTGSSGYNGYFYKGSMSVSGQSMSGPFAVMRYEQEMPCVDGYQGIFGIAYKGMDQYYTPDPSYAATSSFSMSQSWCNNAESYDGAAGVYVDPLMGALESLSAAQDRMWGLYWSGQAGANTGNLYVGENAKSNSHYTSGTPLVAPMYDADASSTANWGFYNVKITQFSVGGAQASVTGYTGYTEGVIDTGTPIVQVPPSIYSALRTDPSSALQIELVGLNRQTVTLRIGTGSELLDAGYVQPASKQATQYIIGFPLWKYYYTVIDVDNKEMSFIHN